MEDSNISSCLVYREHHSRAGEVFLGGEIEEIEAQLFLADEVGRFVVVLGQLPNRAI